MADSKASDFNVMTTINADDIVLTVNDPGGTPQEQVITYANFISTLAHNPASADLDMNSNQIIGMPATQTLAAEAISKAHLDTAIGSFITSTLAADLDANSNQIVGLPAAQTLDDHALSKKHFEDNTVELPTLTALQAWRKNAGNTAIEAYTPYSQPGYVVEAALPFVIDGGGTVITTGIKGDLEVPFDCTIQGVRMAADQSGSIVIDIWKDVYANFPPTDADTITASAVPTISTAVKSEDVTLTGWTTSLTKGDWLRFNVDSVTTLERVTLSLLVNKV